MLTKKEIKNRLETIAVEIGTLLGVLDAEIDIEAEQNQARKEVFKIIQMQGRKQ